MLAFRITRLIGGAGGALLYLRIQDTIATQLMGSFAAGEPTRSPRCLITFLLRQRGREDVRNGPNAAKPPPPQKKTGTVRARPRG